MSTLKSSNNTQTHIPSNLPKGLSIQKAIRPHAPQSGTSSSQQQLVNRKRIASPLTGHTNKIPRSTPSNVLATGEM